MTLNEIPEFIPDIENPLQVSPSWYDFITTIIIWVSIGYSILSFYRYITRGATFEVIPEKKAMFTNAYTMIYFGKTYKTTIRRIWWFWREITLENVTVRANILTQSHLSRALLLQKAEMILAIQDHKLSGNLKVENKK